VQHPHPPPRDRGAEREHHRSERSRPLLEHSRAFVFEHGDEASYYLGSADLMPRNLDYRIEAVVPVEDARAQQELMRAFDTLLPSNVHAWELKGDGKWQRVRTRKGERARATQTLQMRSVRARQRRRTQKRNG
jgi:polyphosphate kinase